MKDSVKRGLGFGLTSGIITTLGLMVGLYASTQSKLIVIEGILIIAIADALSDAMGMHISEETSNGDSKEIWGATISTFFSKFGFALTFLIPVLIFQLQTAIIVSVIWGLFLITGFSYILAKKKKENVLKIVSEHLVIVILVIVVTYLIGDNIASFLGG